MSDGLNTEMDGAALPGPSASPEVRGIAPYLTIDGAMRAAAFYVAAFGAEEVACMPPDAGGRTMHVHLHLNGGSLMMSDPFPGCGEAAKPAGFNLLLHVADVAALEALWARAVAAGAEVAMPLQDMFWGDRYGQLRDPFGVTWALAAPSR